MLEVIGAVTNIGRRMMSATLMSSFNFTVTDFAIGDRGHDPANPRVELTPDLTQEELNRGFPLLHGPDVLEEARFVEPYCSQYTFTLERGEAVGEWSQINLIATVVTSPGSLPDGTPLPGVGETFLFAVVNRPLTFRTPVDEDTYSIKVRF